MTVLGLEKDDGSGDIIMARADAATGRLLVSASGAGSGTVTSVSVVSANGFAGTVATATTTPAITLTTTVTGILSGNGTAISAASTTGSGAVVLANTPTLITPVLGVATGTSLALSAASALTLGTSTTNDGAIILKNATNANTLTIKSGATGASYSLTLPTAQGGASTFLQNDGAGVLSWVAGASGANTALSNLAAVAINTALLPGAAGTLDFGSTTLPWASFWLSGTSLTPGTNQFHITGASTGGVRTITLPDASGTVTVLGNTTTGSGSIVLATSPTLVTPTLGVASATSINKVAITAPATSATLTIADGKTLTVSDTMTLAGPTGSGNVVFATSPTLVTPTLGVASATSINKVAITAPATSATLTIADGKTVTHNSTTTFAGTDGKTLTVNNSLTLAGTDATTMTFPTTSASIARTDAGQTFTGVQAMTSPDITTSLTTPSATFALVNATATTINFGGAATAINMGGGSGCIVKLGGGANAAELRFLEPSAGGTNFTSFKAQAQAADITYTLPAAQGAASTFLQNDGSGGLTWAAATGGSSTKTIFSTIFETTGRFPQTFTGSGADTFGTSGVDVSTGGTGTSSAILEFQLPGGDFNWYSKDNAFTAVARILTAPTTGVAFIGFGIAAAQVTGSNITFNATHQYGFKLSYSASTLTASCTNANAVTETTATFTYGTASNTNLFHAEYTLSTNIKFYMNNTLLSTSTTNLPTTFTNGNFGSLAVSNQATATTFALRAGSFIAERVVN